VHKLNDTCVILGHPSSVSLLQNPYARWVKWHIFLLKCSVSVSAVTHVTPQQTKEKQSTYFVLFWRREHSMAAYGETVLRHGPPIFMSPSKVRRHERFVLFFLSSSLPSKYTLILLLFLLRLLHLFLFHSYSYLSFRVHILISRRLSHKWINSRLVLLITLQHGPHRKHHFQQF
jgi:hypothetical protein